MQGKKICVAWLLSLALVALISVLSTFAALGVHPEYMPSITFAPSSIWDLQPNRALVEAADNDNGSALSSSGDISSPDDRSNSRSAADSSGSGGSRSAESSDGGSDASSSSKAETPAPPVETSARVTAPLLNSGGSPSGCHDSAAIPGEALQALGSQKPCGGKLHVLLILQRSFRFPDIWRAFFSQAPPGSYTVFIHCAKGCNQREIDTEIPGAIVIPTVPSSRCWDLVTPHKALSMAALDSGVHKDVLEKFLLASDTTLPVKPFTYIFRELMSRRESDYCFHSEKSWPSVKMRYSRRRRREALYIEKGDGNTFFLVKHQQFVVLNRHDSQALVNLWDMPQDSRKIVETWKAPLVGSYWEWYDDRHVKKLPRIPMAWFYRGGTFCADEVAPFALAHGIFLPGQDLPCPLNESTKCSSIDELVAAKRCTTLSVGSKNSIIQDMQERDPNLDLDEKTSHAIEFRKLGLPTMRLLRNSSYLFARKFSKKLGPEDLPGYIETLLQ